MYYFKKYYKLFILNLLLFLSITLIISFVQKSQKLFVWEAKLIVEENNNRNQDENLMNYIYPTRENEPYYQKIIDYIISNHTIKKFISLYNYNFEIVQKEPKNLKIKKIEIYKPFEKGIYKFKTNEKNENYFILSNQEGYIKVKFLDYDNSVKKFTSKLNLRVTSSSEFLKGKNLPQFSPNIIHLSFSSKDEYEGEIFKNFINFLFEDNLNQKKETYSKLKTLIKNQIDYYNSEIENIDEKIKNIKLEIVNKPNVLNDIVFQEYMTNFEINNLINYLNNNGKYIISQDSALNNYLIKISIMEDSLRILTLKYGKESGEYKYYKMILDSLKTNLKNVIQKRIIYLNEKLKLLKNQEGQFKEVSDKTIELENELSKLNTQKQSIMEILSLLNKKLKEIEMEEVSMKNDFKLFQISENPIIKSKLNSLSRNILFSILFSLVFSIIVVLLKEYLKRTIRNKEELEIKLNIKNSFEIPLVNEEENTPLNVYLSKNFQKILNGSYAIESFRIMVLKSILNKNMNLIGITSSIQGDGKTFITLNTCAILAMMKNNVLMIDTDLRKKSLSHYFSLNNEKGLSNIIEDLNYKNLIYELNGNLFLVPAGNEIIDPLGVFISSKFKNFIDYISNHFEYIIFDLPPILGISETSVIIEHLDSVLFVIRVDKTTISQILNALELINSQKISAYIINGVEFKTDYYDYYYYKQKVFK
ncbi:MAG: CpsD/CapB family tyrosine-protein kinase [candidate division WOR-3 bacterium]